MKKKLIIFILLLLIVILFVAFSVNSKEEVNNSNKQTNVDSSIEEKNKKEDSLSTNDSPKANDSKGLSEDEIANDSEGTIETKQAVGNNIDSSSSQQDGNNEKNKNAGGTIKMTSLETLINKEMATYGINPITKQYIVTVKTNNLTEDLQGKEYSIIIDEEEFSLAQNQFEESYVYVAIESVNLTEEQLKKAELKVIN